MNFSFDKLRISEVFGIEPNKCNRFATSLKKEMGAKNHLHKKATPISKTQIQL